MDIREKRQQVFEKLFQMVDEISPATNHQLFGKNGFQREDDHIAIFVEHLKRQNHPFLVELDSVGLLDYYYSVLYLLKREMIN